MAKISTLGLKGESGKGYDFNVYSYGTDFKSVGAVYAVNKRYESNSGGHKHTVLYIGRTEDLSDRFDDHHKENCFDRNDANCICTHSDETKNSREKKEGDLLANWKPDCNG